MQAANARDSGCTVIVGTRPPEHSPSRAQAQADGFPGNEHRGGDAGRRTSCSSSWQTLPSPRVYASDIAPHLRAGQTLCFCHGFNVLYGAIRPPENVNTVLFVPNAPGRLRAGEVQEG